MDTANREFWRQMQLVYPDRFVGRRVLEVGSQHVEGGTIRYFFDACRYTGVDWRPGPGVDVVTLAHEMTFDEPFEVIASASMLEHDPYWDKSLHRICDLLRPDGILFLTWGAALNHTHQEDTAPDGEFHPLPAGKVMKLLMMRGLHIERMCYQRQLSAAGGWGELCMVAVGPKGTHGVPLITALVPEDAVGFASGEVMRIDNGADMVRKAQVPAA